MPSPRDILHFFWGFYIIMGDWWNIREWDVVYYDNQDIRWCIYFYTQVSYQYESVYYVIESLNWSNRALYKQEMLILQYYQDSRDDNVS